MRSNKKGFTSVELIIGLAVGAILILMIGAISSIGNASFDKAMKESSIYNDAFSGLNLIKFLGRQSHTMITYDTAVTYNTVTLEPGVLELDNNAFGLDDNKKELICLNLNDNSKTSIIKDADVLTLTLNPPDSNPANINTVTVTFHVEKQKENFNISTSITRRN